jgi:pimeloyl-ACP methyl ester carboxylesterase
MIEPSARPGMTREKAREDMAPPQFAGMTSHALRERFRSRVQPFPLPPEFDQVQISNFEMLEDGTVRTRLSRENHLRIIDTLWDHYPSQLYPQVLCPVLMMPARMANDDSVTERTFRRQESVAKAEQSLPKVKVVWLEDSIHDVPAQRPELVASTIREAILSGFFG